MFFNSIEFAIFLPIVLLIRWVIPANAIAVRNGFLIAASYYFYACWDWRFLSLLIVSSVIDFVVGLNIERASNRRGKFAFLMLSLTVNLGLLAFFKYFNFFVENFTEAFTLLGGSVDSPTLAIVLPAGISFYTFQTLSYSIDIYRGRTKPVRDPVAFFAFVSFFPQLVAGPIERAANLLPQFQTQTSVTPSEVRDAMRQILWGLFMKCVIADNCGKYVDLIFADHPTLPASALWTGALLFAPQIYGDFSGYSHIAIGSAKLLGFDLSRNFDRPYFATSPVDFWRRWHVSLSSWFRDYVYIPLGGNRDGTAKTVRNIFVVFLVSGLWRGAAWTFVVWGAYHGLVVILEVLLRSTIEGGSRCRRWIRSTGSRVLTFFIVLFGWVLFRSASIHEFANYVANMFDTSLFEITPLFPARILVLIVFVLVAEWLQGDRRHALDMTDRRIPKPVRWIVYQGLCFAIYTFGIPDSQFIYFQF